MNRRDVNVVLLHVVDVSAPIKCISPLEFIYSMEQSLVLDGESFLAESQRLLKDAGVRKVDYALKQGNPAEELFQTARALPADLIIVGAEGHTAVQHFLQGSISHRIAMESPCAVAVIKTRRKDINCAPPLTA